MTRKTLDGLVYAHQCSVPFETADLVALGETPSLEMGDLYQKIVVDRHGGFCFELNKMFELLLRSVGFEVRPCLSRAVRGREGRMPINHRGHACFPRWGAAFGRRRVRRIPLLRARLSSATSASRPVRGEVYIPRRIDEHWWAIDRISQAKRDLYGDEGPSRRQTELEFCLATVEDIDFTALSFACSQPGTVFRDTVMANIRTASGFKSISRGVLNVRESGASEKTPLEDDFAVSRGASGTLRLHAILRSLGRCGTIPRRIRAITVAWRSGSASALQALGRGFKSLSDHQVFDGSRVFRGRFLISAEVSPRFAGPSGLPVFCRRCAGFLQGFFDFAPRSCKKMTRF